MLCWQLLDLPGIIEGAKDGKGRGRQVLNGFLLLSTSPFKMISFFILSLDGMPMPGIYLFNLRSSLDSSQKKIKIQNKTKNKRFYLGNNWFNSLQPLKSSPTKTPQEKQKGGRQKGRGEELQYNLLSHHFVGKWWESCLSWQCLKDLLFQSG